MENGGVPSGAPAGHSPRVEELLADLHLPHLPSTAELRARAEEMFESSPSVDEIVARARELVSQAVAVELLPQRAPQTDG